MKKVLPVLGAAFGLMTVAAGSASAAVVFSENFNGYGNANAAFNSTQAISGLPVEAAGSVPGWTASGTGSVHGVDRSNGAGTDWAVMFYDTNVLTHNAGILANTAGVTYTVSFEGAPGAYASAAQASDASDFVRFLLTDSTALTVGNYDYFPGAFPAGQLNSFSGGTFSYIGTGTGALTLSLSDALVDNRFGGSIDNLVISDSSTAVPEPASMMLLASGLIGAAAIRRRSKATGAAV